MSVDACRIVELPRLDDARGSLTFIEAERQIPFPIRRVYYLFGVPEGGERGGHAHRALRQLLIAVAGSFEVVLDDGVRQRRVRLDSPSTGLLIVPGIWRELEAFSAGAVCLVLASEPYDEADYWRDYEEFRRSLRSAVASPC